jgi:hypothetical protein
MKGYVARKGNRWYAVIYEGTDPVTGREVRRWHPAGTERADAERLAARLASELEDRNDAVRGLTFGAFLTSRWLPGKRLALEASTYAGYRRNIDNHISPALGRIRLRALRDRHLEAFYDRLLHPRDSRSTPCRLRLRESRPLTRHRSIVAVIEAPRDLSRQIGSRRGHVVAVPGQHRA